MISANIKHFFIHRSGTVFDKNVLPASAQWHSSNNFVVYYFCREADISKMVASVLEKNKSKINIIVSLDDAILTPGTINIIALESIDFSEILLTIASRSNSFFALDCSAISGVNNQIFDVSFSEKALNMGNRIGIVSDYKQAKISAREFYEIFTPIAFEEDN